MKEKRGPSKPARPHVPGPTVEYSAKGSRVLTPEEDAARKGLVEKPNEKPARTKRSESEGSDR